MPSKADSIGRNVGEKLKSRQPALPAVILHSGTQSARNALSNTLTDSYTRFSLKTQPYLKSITRTPKRKPCIITLLY